MRKALRILATFISAVAAMYLSVFLIGALLFARSPGWIPPVVSLLLSILVARFVWTSFGSPHPGLGRAIGLGALITGGIAFSVGFFGPIIFTPSANQGPMLGIFVTGPLGLLLGAIGGGLYWFTRKRRSGSGVDANSV